MSASGSYGALRRYAVGGFMADGVTFAALPLLALPLTDSAVLIAGLPAVNRLGWLAAPVIGDAFDRHDRRLLLGYLQPIRIGAIAVLIGATLTGSVSLLLLYLVSAILSVAEVCADVGVQASIPDLVGAADLPEANRGILTAEVAFRSLFGGAAGAALLGVTSWLPASIAAACHISAWRSMRQIAKPMTKRRRSRGGLFVGLALIWRRRNLRVLTATVAAWNFATDAALAALVLHATSPAGLAVTEVEYGALLAAYGLGGIVGARAAARVRARDVRVLVTRCAPGLAAGWILVGLVPSITVVGIGTAVAGAYGMAWRMGATELRQRAAPRAVQGRIVGAYRFVGRGLGATGAVTAGVLTDAAGARACFLLAALLIATFAVVAVRSSTQQP